MLGPGKALRGEGIEAIEETIDSLRDYSYKCFQYFMIQIMFFHVSSFALMWILHSILVSLIINVILLYFLFLFVLNLKDITDKLHVAENEAVTGAFVNLISGKMGALDKRSSL